MIEFFQYDFLIKALMGGILLAICTGLLSPWVVVKRYAFMSEGISHSTLLSLSLTLSFVSLENTLSFYMIYVCPSLILIGILATFTYKDKLPSDTIMGLFLSATLALGLLLHGLLGKSQMDLGSFLFGNILLLENADLYALLILTFISFSFFALNFKKIMYATFDPEGARISGISLLLYHYSFFFLLGVVILSAIKFCGTLLTGTLLIFPGAFALKISKTMQKATFFSVLFSLLSILIGLFFSHQMDWPPGATLTLTQLCLFLLTFFRKGKTL